MKILFNCINNTVGGGVQNSANFIQNALEDKSNDFLFLVSPAVEYVLEDLGITSKSIIPIGSSKNLYELNKFVRSIEKDFSPDVVYTMAGPTYIKFKNTHVLGISTPYITHAKLWQFFLGDNKYSGIVSIIKNTLKGLISRLTAEYFLFQTNSSRDGFVRRYKVGKKSTFVVPNAIGPMFTSNSHSYKPWGCGSGNRLLVCPSAYYSHKKIENIFELSEILVNKNITSYSFRLTIPHNQYELLCNRYPLASKLMSNVGPYSYSDVLDIYEGASAVVLPSVLETFSTVYIEAMALGLPLFVPKIDFALDICGSYPLYFEPGSAHSLFDALLKQEASEEADFRDKLKNTILDKYGTQQERYEKIISVLNYINARHS